MSPKERGDNRFRYYDESHYLRLNTIKLLQSLGYGLKDISSALAPFTDADGRCTPTGQEMSQKISKSLLNVREDLLAKRREIDDALKGIDDMAPQLMVCLGCKDSQTLKDCIDCKKGPAPVIQMAREQQSSRH